MEVEHDASGNTVYHFNTTPAAAYHFARRAEDVRRTVAAARCEVMRLRLRPIPDQWIASGHMYELLRYEELEYARTVALDSNPSAEPRPMGVQS